MSGVTFGSRESTAERFGVAEGDLLLPLAGAWSATLKLEQPGQRNWNGAQVALEWYGQRCLGTVESSSVAQGLTTVFVVGGAGKLAAEVPAKHYENAAALRVFRELCDAAGETAASDRLPSTSQLSQFPRRKTAAGDVLDDLARALGLVWGVYLDGRVWLGKPPWSAAAAFEADKLDEDAIYQTSEYSARAFGPLPGQTLNGRRIACARYFTNGQTGTRLRLWLSDGELTLEVDGLRSGIAAIVRETVPLVWLGKYPGAIRAVRSSGTWDVELDERRMPPLANVRPRVFCPGAKIVPSIGDRVEVSFEQADPRFPVADLFEPGNATRGIARIDDPVGWLVTVYASVAGVPVVVKVDWTDTDPLLPPLPPPTTPPTPIPAGAYARPLRITGASNKAFLP